MSESSTATFVSPALDHIIERPRLIKLIEDADARVVVFAAPAGYGKTTLAKQWSARQTGPVAWYRTTRASGDVGALAVGLDEVLAKATNPKNRNPRRIGAIAAVNPKAGPLARALGDMYAHTTRDTLLVIDEWEAAGTAEADELLSLLLAEVGFSLLVTSRSRPSWFTTRLEVYGEGLEIGIEELVMSDDEAFAVLAAPHDDPDSQALVSTAGGWPAVLGLAAVSPVAGRGEGSRSSRTLYDYFASEILGAAPESVQDALRVIAVASIHDKLTGEVILGDAFNDLLVQAVSRALVVVDRDQSFSLHPLLSDLLVEELRRSPRDVRTTLARRLGALIDFQLWDAALSAAETLGDAEFVAQALDRAIEQLLREGRVTTLERWVNAGRAAGVSTALLDYTESEVALRRGEFDRATMLATHAGAFLAGDRAADAHLVVARAAHLDSRTEICAHHIAQALRLATDRSTVASAYWLRYVHGVDVETQEIAQWLSDFEEASDDSIEHHIRVAHGKITIGNLDGTLRRRLREYAFDPESLRDVDPMVSSAYLNVLSSGLGDCAEFGRALVAAAAEERLANEYGLLFVRSFAALNLARAQMGLRQFAVCRRTLSSLGKGKPAAFDSYIQAYQSMLFGCLYLSMRDLDRAYAAVAVDPDESAGRVAVAELAAVRSLVQAARGDQVVTRSVETARALSRTVGVHATTSVALAICDLRSGNDAAAFAKVRSALDSGAVLGLVLGLRCSPALVAYLSTAPEVHRRLLPVLVESNDAAIAKQLGIEIPRSAVRSKLLSPRELELHGLISQGLTNAEIARLLFISESTVKVHVRHILEKLGARSRAEAARVWQEPC